MIQPKINHEIKADCVLVVNERTKGVDNMELNNAIAIAEQEGKDVIMLNYNNGKPIVKIEEYDKYIYREKKKKKEQQKKQRANATTLKEIRMLYSIAENDICVKAKNIDRILEEGDKVKVSIMYKGRAIRMVHDGIKLMEYVESKLKVNHRVDGDIKVEGNKVIMFVLPIK